MRAVIRWSAVAMASWLGLGAPAFAEDLDKATENSLHDIITQQLDALSRDDAVKAESFAAPGIKSKFPDPKDFTAMVQSAYGALIQPRSTHFNKSSSTALGPMQEVTIVDKAGVPWTAIYSFEQVDGQWRISGCVLVKEQSTTI